MNAEKNDNLDKNYMVLEIIRWNYFKELKCYIPSKAKWHLSPFFKNQSRKS